MYFIKMFKMKYLISFVLVFVCTYAQAQEPTYVPMKSNYQFKGIKMDSLFILPNLDTANAREVTGAVVRMGSAYYWYNGTAWVALAGGGGATDTTSLSNRINDKIDSLRRVSTQVSFKKNGTWYNAYTDSLGGQNGRWGNDTALVILAKVHNGTGTTLARGTVVMISGSNGDVASVILANNKYDSTSARTIGLVKDPINSGDTGWVVTQGQASKLNLGSYTAGDVLYLDSINGGLTKTKPIAPYHQVFVCIVERANNGNGLAYVKPLNGQEIEELHDVRIINPLNNQILVYSDTQQIWKNRPFNSIVSAYSPLSLPQNIDGSFNITIDSASTGTDGYLTAFSYTKFNNKLGASDTVSLSNRINTKLNATDTASLSNRINARLLISDTSAMLNNYQRTSEFPVATFGAGSGASGDTSAFTTSAIYGSFYNSGGDTIILTAYNAVLQGTSPSITPTIYINDTLNATAVATKVVNSPSAVTSTTLGNTVTSLNNTKIPPGNFVWVTTGTVTTKPTYFNLTLIGYRKR